MAFRFSLAAVLRLREIHEQREERLLTRILAQVTQTREAISNLDLQLAQAASRREAELRRRMTAIELHVAYGLSAMLKESKQLREQQLVQFEQQRDKQIAVYRRAHQGRELLTNMRQEQQEEFLTEQGRKEQKALDDLFIARMRRG